MASSSIDFKGVLRPIVLYCTLDDIITHMRANRRAAVTIGDQDANSIMREDANLILYHTMRWINGRIRREIGNENIPLPRPVPDEISMAAISYGCYLMRSRVFGGAEFTSDDIGNKFMQEAKDAIEDFIANIETYSYLLNAKPAKSTAPRFQAGQETILFPYVGLDGVEGGRTEKAQDNTLPTDADHTPYLDSISEDT